MDTSTKPEGSSFAARIVLPSALAIILFIAATFLFIIPSFERNMMDRKRETIRELNNSAHSLLLKFHSDEKAGLLTGAQARKKAAESVRGLRYGPEGKDYFWITDLGPKMIMHPYRPDLDGKDLSDFRDSHGKRMFVEFAEIGRRDGAGYVDYMWQWKDEPARIVPKLSHVRLFSPWGWVIGTGIYIEDVREEISRLESSLIKLSLLIAGIIAVILLYVNQQSLRIERSRRQAEKLLLTSEEKYRKLVEAAAEGIIMVLADRPAYSNRVVLEMLGYSAEEFEKLTLAQLLHPDSPASVEYLTELLESGGHSPQVDASLRRKDGEALRALLTASKLVFGGRHGFILSVRDIDRIKKTEEELAASREQYRLLTDSINLGVLRSDFEKWRVTDANPAAVLMEEFARASTVEEVLAARARLPWLVKTLSDSGADSSGITRLIAAAADAATARFVEFSVRELGEPPAPFAFMALGSQARGEQTLVTDQDNALVYADPAPGLEDSCSLYFQAMGGKVCGWLNEAGYPFCKGGAMANDPKWCRPLSDWKEYFSGWARLTDPQALLDVNVFFDFRCAAGEKEIEERLRAHVRSAVRDQKIFFLNLVNNALLFKAPLGFRNAVLLDEAGEHRGTFDAKQLLRVITDFARIYALRADIAALPTLGRLASLAEANVLDQAEKESFSQAFETLMRLRLKRQAARSGAGEAPDNRLDPARLSQADQAALRDAASAAGGALGKLKDLVKFVIA